MIQAIANDRTPEWYSARSTGIGASEAAAVCGLSRWETPLDVWARKTGRVDGKTATGIMELGTHMEAAVFDRVHQAHPLSRRAPGLFRHPEIPCVLASPDGELEDGRGLEIKVTSDRNDEIGDGVDELPAYWLIQAQQQMAVCDFPAVLFSVVILPEAVRSWMLDQLGPEEAAYVIGRGVSNGTIELRYWNIERHSSVIDSVLNRDVEFWNHVETNTPPEIDWQHARSCQAVRAAFRDVYSEGNFVPLDDEAAILWREHQAQKALIKDAEKVCERITAEMFTRIQHANGGLLPDGSLLKKIVVGESVVPSYTRKSYSFLKSVKGPK